MLSVSSRSFYSSGIDVKPSSSNSIIIMTINNNNNDNKLTLY